MKASLPFVFSRSPLSFYPAIASASLVLVAACGGAPPAQAPVSNASDTAPVTAASAAPAATTSTTTTTTTTATKPKFDPNAPYVDSDEFTGTKSVTPLLSKSTSASAFPAKTIDEGQCWSTVNLSGKHMDDYTALTVACGPPGGLLPYINPVSGKLHSVKDQTDIYSVKLTGGFCYRYFAVADDSIRDIDILVEKNGAIVADDKQDAPVAIIEATKSWCMSEDQTYEFHVKIDGDGTGAYAFGIWARPQAKNEH